MSDNDRCIELLEESLKLRETLAETESRVLELEEKYFGLIMAVSSKYEGASRNETALKYIRQCEEIPCLESNVGAQEEKP